MGLFKVGGIENTIKNQNSLSEKANNLYRSMLFKLKAHAKTVFCRFFPSNGRSK